MQLLQVPHAASAIMQSRHIAHRSSTASIMHHTLALHGPKPCMISCLQLLSCLSLLMQALTEEEMPEADRADAAATVRAELAEVFFKAQAKLQDAGPATFFGPAFKDKQGPPAHLAALHVLCCGCCALTM